MLVVLRRILLALAALAVAGTAQAQSILNWTTHADYFIAPAISATVGSSVIRNPIYIDDDLHPPSIFQTVVDATNASMNFYAPGASTAENHAPYPVINASACCANGQGDDALYYAKLLSQGAILTQAEAAGWGGKFPSRIGPGTLESAATSPNSNDGTTGWGVEFGLSSSYLGLDTSEDSWTSAEMAAFFAALKYSHQTWNWFDIKGAFRQTASHWSTGYSHTAYGYGFVDWTRANAVAGPSSLYLQPPGVTMANGGFYSRITLYPFRQTRRAYEVVYSVNPAYTWPVKNEYTAADIAASGATLLYTSNGSDVTPAYTYTPAASGTLTVVAFTTDGIGNYSRVEEFSTNSISLTVGTACLQ